MDGSLLFQFKANKHCLLSLRFIKTPIIGDQMDELIEASGVTWALVEDAASAVLKMVTDEKIIGQYRKGYQKTPLTKLGRAFTIVPRDWEGAPNGYMDLDQDDFKEGTLWHWAQAECLKPFFTAVAMVRSYALMALMYTNMKQSKESEIRG